MGTGPQPYPVVYDTMNGLQYILGGVGQIGIPTDNNAITALTGDVMATGPGSAAATIASSTVTGKLLTGYVSGAGTISATDSILSAFNKLNGNVALKQNTLSAVLSSASAGGAASASLTVAGLTTAKTIYAVTQSIPGANSTSVVGYSNTINGSLTVIWTADPGAGAQVVVTFA